MSLHGVYLQLICEHSKHRKNNTEAMAIAEMSRVYKNFIDY